MPRTRSLRPLAMSPKRTDSPGPPSPTFSEATNASAMNFGPNGPDKIITRGDLRASVYAYEDVRCQRQGHLPPKLLAVVMICAIAVSKQVCGLSRSTSRNVPSDSELCRCNGDLRIVRMTYLILCQANLVACLD